jgi:hypothetical protein
MAAAAEAGCTALTRCKKPFDKYANLDGTHFGQKYSATPGWDGNRTNPISLSGDVDQHPAVLALGDGSDLHLGDQFRPSQPTAEDRGCPLTRHAAPTATLWKCSSRFAAGKGIRHSRPSWSRAIGSHSSGREVVLYGRSSPGGRQSSDPGGDHGRVYAGQRLPLLFTM